ncbi:phosphoribosylamine--glycine ligase [Candidatus Peregrinibacteria bacterium CG1_02_54_53]|nr:MAG: phosphoribosylamine--glycine ligase [Candidatus Peregrinibacteria bacterium CG1_02_54_53]
MTDQPKKFLFVSYDGTTTDLAWAVSREGHQVRLCLEAAGFQDVGKGFVEVVTDWKEHVDWADIVLFDHIGKGEDAQAIRKKGKLCVGGTPYTDRLENDRTFGQEELKRNKVRIIPYQEFRSFDEGIKYVQDNPGRYVIKPSGDAQNLKQLLFVGNEDDGSDVIRVLGAYSETWSDTISVFQLQRRVAGVEVATGAFFNGRQFMSPVCVNFEHKRLFPGELGVSTGEMGTSMFWTPHSPIFEATLRPFEAILAEEGYVGYIDVNCIVNSNGIYPLEFTCRFGFPFIDLQLEGITEPIGELLLRMAHGEGNGIKVKRGYQVCALIVVPPFPFNDPKTFESFSEDAVVVFKKKMPDGIHIGDLKQENEQWLITGQEGVALVVSGAGMTMRDAQKQMYTRIQNILISNMYYRTDIGDRWMDDSDKLRSWEYL